MTITWRMYFVEYKKLACFTMRQAFFYLKYLYNTYLMCYYSIVNKNRKENLQIRHHLTGDVYFFVSISVRQTKGDANFLIFLAKNGRKEENYDTYKPFFTYQT